jgi:hypothetical protein
MDEISYAHFEHMQTSENMQSRERQGKTQPSHARASFKETAPCKSFEAQAESGHSFHSTTIQREPEKWPACIASSVRVSHHLPTKHHSALSVTKQSAPSNHHLASPLKLPRVPRAGTAEILSGSF